MEKEISSGFHSKDMDFVELKHFNTQVHNGQTDLSSGRTVFGKNKPAIIFFRI